VGGLGQCECVISVAMYSSVSPGAIGRLRGREQEVQRRWVASGTVGDHWRVMKDLGW
jgi:muconolactone delta-isomerase